MESVPWTDWACNCFSEFQTMFAEADRNNDGLIGTSHYLVWIKSISIVCSRPIQVNITTRQLDSFPLRFRGVRVDDVALHHRGQHWSRRGQPERGRRGDHEAVRERERGDHYQEIVILPFYTLITKYTVITNSHMLIGCQRYVVCRVEVIWSLREWFSIKSLKFKCYC